jgi:hypothetical protein
MENSLKKIQTTLKKEKEKDKESIKVLMYPTIDTDRDEAKERIGVQLLPVERIKVYLEFSKESKWISVNIKQREFKKN